jgi:uncharacterized NAD(P)/FAD-binding protein YdhS
MTFAHLPVGQHSCRMPRSVAIVGGGASGVLMAAHLLRNPLHHLLVTIIEKRSTLGRGLAYSTTIAEHVLNVRASNMSGYADDPRHFLRWLATRGFEPADPETCFAPRSVYGEYLEQLIEPHIGAGRLRIADEECVGLVTHGSSIELRLASGASETCDICVLATGHDAKPFHGHSLLAPSYDKGCYPRNLTDPVLIVGTGLSMVDTCLALILRGHRGKIVAVSRRGLLPKVHRKTKPVILNEADIPSGHNLLEITRWVRGLVRSTIAQGGTWRDIVDGLRPHTQSLWRRLPETSKRQFLRHLKPYWDIHRHRLAPQSEKMLAAALARGQIEVVAGRILKTEVAQNGLTVQIERRQRGGVEQIEVARIYNCKGVISDLGQSSSPLMRSIFDAGLAQVDKLHLGLDVSEDSALLDRNGTASDRIYAVGPLTRGAFLEIEAVPDIRVQCQRLAQQLVKTAADSSQYGPNAIASATSNSKNAIRHGSGF